MAIEVEAPEAAEETAAIKPRENLAPNPLSEADHGADCSCDHSAGDSELLRQIIEVREVFWEDPADFQHDQVPFLGFEVDSGLKIIIENLWVMGLPTDFSCEGYTELCHSELPSSEFHAQIVFLRIGDAVRIFGLLTQLFGSGTLFGPEGFELTAMDGDIDDLIENDSDENSENFLQLINGRARGEIRLHPNYLPHLRDVLDEITSLGEFDAKRSQLEIAEDLDEAYEILEVDPELRELAERSCDCGHDHS